MFAPPPAEFQTKQREHYAGDGDREGGQDHRDSVGPSAKPTIKLSMLNAHAETSRRPIPKCEIPETIHGNGFQDVTIVRMPVAASRPPATQFACDPRVPATRYQGPVPAEASPPRRDQRQQRLGSGAERRLRIARSLSPRRSCSGTAKRRPARARTRRNHGPSPRLGRHCLLVCVFALVRLARFGIRFPSFAQDQEGEDQGRYVLGTPPTKHHNAQQRNQGEIGARQALGGVGSKRRAVHLARNDRFRQPRAGMTTTARAVADNSGRSRGKPTEALCEPDHYARDTYRPTRPSSWARATASARELTPSLA